MKWSLYALLVREEEALRLLERYDEDSAMMLLPMAILYYRKYDFKTALSYLKRIMQHNPDLKKFFRILHDGIEQEPDHMLEGYYQPFTLEELFACMVENEFLFDNAGCFILWAYNELVKPKKKK